MEINVALGHMLTTGRTLWKVPFCWIEQVKGVNVLDTKNEVIRKILRYKGT